MTKKLYSVSVDGEQEKAYLVATDFYVAAMWVAANFPTTATAIVEVPAEGVYIAPKLLDSVTP